MLSLVALAILFAILILANTSGMFHLLANSVALANVADTEVAALANDDIFYSQNSHYVPDVDMYLQWVYTGAVTMTRLKLNSPKIRQITPIDITPINTTLLPPTDPNWADYTDTPLMLRKKEEIQLLATDSAAGPNNCYVVYALSYTPTVTPAPTNDLYTLRGTGTTTVTAGAWSTAAITWDTILPEGTYAVVGGIAFSTTGVAFRCIFPNMGPGFQNQSLRPGGLALATIGLRSFWPQYKGGLGLWGYFTTITLPRIQMLCNAADTAQTVLLDLVKVA